jgi:hypothetical protein
VRLLKWLAGLVGVVVLAIVVIVVGARFGDGPRAILPGGELTSGELFTGPEPDWTFARDIPEMELQLVEPTVSRTIWLQVHDKKLYVVSAYMNSAVGKIWKKWPAQAEEDGRAVVRVDGKRYPRQLVRLHVHAGVLVHSCECHTHDTATKGDITAFAVSSLKF